MRGMTLVELLVGLAVVGILLMAAAPSLFDWIRNLQIRSAAESILNGIQLARTEAVRRNLPTRFQLVSSLDAQCAVSDAGRHWVVNLDADRATDPAGQCHKDNSETVAPTILQKATAASGSVVVVDASGGSAVYAFNSVGQQISVDGTPPLRFSQIEVRSAQGDCAKADGSGGTVRCLRIEVARGGQARLCDPGLAKTAANRSLACQED